MMEEKAKSLFEALCVILQNSDYTLLEGQFCEGLYTNRRLKTFTFTFQQKKETADKPKIVE